MISLFVYGSLMSAKVFEKVVGRAPTAGVAAILENFHRYKVKDAAYPAILVKPGATVEGLVISDITEEEIELLDHFEGDEYERVPVTVVQKDGDEYLDCYVYIWNGEKSYLYGTWDYDIDFKHKEAKFLQGFPYFHHDL